MQLLWVWSIIYIQKKKDISFPSVIWINSPNKGSSLRPTHGIFIAATIGTFVLLLVLLLLLFLPGFQWGNLWQLYFLDKKIKAKQTNKTTKPTYKDTSASGNSQQFGCSSVKFADEETLCCFVPHCGFTPTIKGKLFLMPFIIIVLGC